MSVTRILAEVKSYGKQYMRNKSAAFFSFAFPVLMILIFGAMFGSGGVGKITIQVQNLDDGYYSTAIMDMMNKTTLVTIKMIPSEVNLTNYIKDKSLDVAILFPADFSEEISKGMLNSSAIAAKVVLYGDPSQSIFGTVASIVGQVVVQLNYNMAHARPLAEMEVRNVASANYSMMDYFLPGVIGITVMTNAMYSMTAVCASQRSKGYSKMLATTLLRKDEWLISKFIFYTILLTTSLLLTYFVGSLVFEMHSSITLLTIVLIAAGAFVFTSMGMLLGTVIKDAESANAVAGAIGFPMMFLSGAFFPLEAAPTWLQAISKGIPLTYFNDALRDTMVFANSASALANLAIVAAIGFVVFVLASKLMSWKE
jgi:ABC-2 type transport system permease protein